MLKQVFQLFGWKEPNVKPRGLKKIKLRNHNLTPMKTRLFFTGIPNTTLLLILAWLSVSLIQSSQQRPFPGEIESTCVHAISQTNCRCIEERKPAEPVIPSPEITQRELITGSDGLTIGLPF
jgi:hypothetical protein